MLPDNIDWCKESLARQCRERGGLQHYYLVDEEGEMWLNDEVACYSDITSDGYDREGYDYIVTLSSSQDYSSSSENKWAREYIDWLVNRSCVAPLFVDKDVFSIIDGCAVIDLRYSQADVGLALMLHRAVFEWAEVIKDKFTTLKEEIGEDMASVLAFIVEDGGTGKWGIAAHHQGHEPFNTSTLTSTGLSAYLKHEAKPDEDSFKKWGYYEDTYTQWSCGGVTAGYSLYEALNYTYPTRTGMFGGEYGGRCTFEQLCAVITNWKEENSI